MSGKSLAAIGLGAVIGALVGVGNLVAGVADNGWTVPAWAACGALIGSAHGVGELITRFFEPPDPRR